MFKFHLWTRIKINKFFSKQDIEIQEIFLDNLAQKKEKEIGAPERKIEVPLSGKILQGFFVFSLLVIFILFVKTFQLQVLENSRFSARAEENKYIISFIKAERGVIYDSGGKQIVYNKPSFDLIFNKENLPEEINKKQKLLKQVSEIIEMSLEDLEEKINQNKGIVLIAENISHEKLILLETKIQDLSGFEIQGNAVREYKEGESFSHLIGYTGKISKEELENSPEVYSGFDYVGRVGLENSYEAFLRKKPGKIRIVRDARGNQISKETISLPESGNSLVLHLNSDLQKKIEQEIKAAFSRVGAKKGVGIALDPRNGGVLALVSLPNFDNNLFSKDADIKDLQEILKDKQEPLFNRAISGKYSTGSIIKPLIAAAALEEKIISPAKEIYDMGYIEIPHKYDPEIVYTFHDWRPHGWTNIRKAIAESCNVYFYIIGGGYKDQQGLGPSKIKKYLELFGWGENKTGIDLPNEAETFIPYPEWKKQTKKEGWWDGDTYNLSIGQGDIMITPLQVAVSFSAIANNGILYKPKVVKEIIDSNKNLIQKIEPEIIRKDFISSQNLQIVREGMRRAVTGYNAPHASSVLLNSLPVSSAAKTGTAQTSMKNHYHNWITVFAPYEKPEIVLTIMIENVPDVQAAALPTAKNILDWYFRK